MTDNDLYQQILGLSSPWRVSAVELRLDKDEILVRVVHDPGLGQAECAVCRRQCPGYDTSDERRWRHLDTCQLKTFLVCSIPRVSCPEHGVRVAYIPWSKPNSRFTSAFEALAILVIKATVTQSRTAEILRLSADQVHDIMHRAVQRGLKRRDDTLVMTDLAIDDKAIASGHRFMTVLSDINHQRVIEMVEGRTLAITRNLFETAISRHQKPHVRSVAMDMWEAYRLAQEQALPHADCVHDRFHIVKHLSEAVDKTRSAEHARLMRGYDDTLSKTKYIWLKNEENLTAKQKEIFDSLVNSKLETVKVWAFKDTFREFFACDNVAQGAAFLENWFAGALKLKNRYLTRIVRMLKEHIAGLLNYLKHRTTTATAEGLNSRIQHIKASARGYRKFQSFRIAVLFHLGKLDLNPQKSL